MIDLRKRDRRKTPASRIRKQLYAIGIGLGVLVFTSIVRAGEPPHPSTVIRTNASTPAAFQVVRTEDSYAAHPVYDLVNTSSITYHHILIQSWSGESLPLLYIGSRSLTPRTHLPSSPLRNPPYNLAPHQHVWFVGSGGTNGTLFILWLEGGKSAYEALSVTNPSK